MTNQEPGWWSERWIAWLRALQVGPETEGQLKSAARAEGQVRLEKGRIVARVWVSDRRQVESRLKVRPWSDKDWRKALDLVAARPDLSQRVLSGTMGPELEAALAEAGLRLFPDKATLGCSCGNTSFRCRHLNYLAVQTAEMLDGTPFLWLELMGKSRPELLAELKARLEDRERPLRSEEDPEGEVALTAAQAGEPLDPARFWETPVDPDAIPVRPGGSTAPDALIRTLGPLPVAESLFLLPSREPLQVEEFIRRMVVRVGHTSAALALGELEPVFRAGPAAGKPVPLAVRLAREVEAVVRAEKAIWLIDDLYGHCPTALALGDEEAAHKPLQEACALLPADLVTVAGRYVGTLAALLEGATFRHVVTLAEWQAGEADDAADWVRALAAAGRPRPPLAPHFQRLQPEVGDEFWIDLQEGGVTVSLKRRAERDLAERLHSNAVASRLLQVVTGMTRSGALSEQEAVAALLAEGGYRGDLQPDPLWLLPLLGPGLYYDPEDRLVTRTFGSWRPGFPRFVYGNWRRDQALMAYQAILMKRWESRRTIEEATACITWWGRLWPGAQDQPTAAESLGPFLHFLWNVAPREATRQRIPPEQAPVIMAGWFTFLEEAYPATRGAFAGHLLACSLQEHYAERCRTAPPDGAGEGALLAWQAEGFRWMGPALFLSTGSYR